MFINFIFKILSFSCINIINLIKSKLIFIFFLNLFNNFKYILQLHKQIKNRDWGLVVGDWTKTKIPNPQSPYNIFFKMKIY